MIKILLLGLALCSLSLKPSAYAMSIVVNGGFEEPDFGAGPGFRILNAIPGWGTDSISSPPLFNQGFEIQFGSIAGTAHGGDQFLELDGNAPSNIFQNLSTVAGGFYQVDFWFSPRPEAAAVENHIDFLWNGATITTLLGDGTDLSNTAWTLYSFVLQATGPTSRLEFVDRSPDDSGNFGGLGGYLDDVSAEQVPGPVLLGRQVALGRGPDRSGPSPEETGVAPAQQTQAENESSLAASRVTKGKACIGRATRARVDLELGRGDRLRRRHVEHLTGELRNRHPSRPGSLED
jgi:hypothetical protein